MIRCAKPFTPVHYVVHLKSVQYDGFDEFDCGPHVEFSKLDLISVRLAIAIISLRQMPIVTKAAEKREKWGGGVVGQQEPIHLCLGGE